MYKLYGHHIVQDWMKSDFWSSTQAKFVNWDVETLIRILNNPGGSDIIGGTCGNDAVLLVYAFIWVLLCSTYGAVYANHWVRSAWPPAAGDVLVATFGNAREAFTDASGTVLNRGGGVVWGVSTRPVLRGMLPSPGTIEVRGIAPFTSAFHEVQSAIYLGNDTYYTPRAGAWFGDAVPGAELHTQQEYYDMKQAALGIEAPPFPYRRPPLAVPFAGAGFSPQIGWTVSDFGLTFRLLQLLPDDGSVVLPALMSAP